VQEVVQLSSPSSSSYGASLQRSSTKKAKAISVAFLLLLWSYIAAHLHEEGDGNYHRLLLLLFCAAQEKEEEEGDDNCRRLLLPAVELRYGASLQRSSMKKATTADVAFFLLWSYATGQQKKAIILRSYVGPRRKRWQLPSASSPYYGATLQHSSMKKATIAPVAFFSAVELRCNATQLEKKGTVVAVTFFLLWNCSVAKQVTVATMPSPSSLSSECAASRRR